MRNFFVVLSLLSASSHVGAEIPDWYKRDIGSNLNAAEAVILYRVESVSLVSGDHNHYIYRTSTTTIEVLKGKAPKRSCYFTQSESEMDSASDVGERRLAILVRDFDSECGLIEPGYGAPGTDEYVELFREALNNDA